MRRRDLIRLTLRVTPLALPNLAAARAPDPLARGVNITAWFRFPASQDPAALRSYLGPGAIAGLVRAGFSFVRLPVDPALLINPAIPPALHEAIRRLTEAGLSVIVSLHPTSWHLERGEADRAELHRAWGRLGPILARHDPDRVMAEPLNEPVFPGDPQGWHRLQVALLATVRAALPRHRIVLTGHDWSSIAGLEALTPVPDRRVIYTFHLYEPVDLTSLAAWRAGLDRAALSRLPFPVRDGSACARLADGVGHADTAGMMRFYCAQGWDEAAMKARIDRAAAWGRRHGVTVFCGEFGATTALNPHARLNWLGAVRRGCEEAGLGWALWGYDDVMGFALSRPPGPAPRLDGDILRALGMPGI